MTTMAIALSNCRRFNRLPLTRIIRSCSSSQSFSDAFEKFEKIKEEVNKPPPPPPPSTPVPPEPVVERDFYTLLRNSFFIDLGDPAGKIVTGTIFHVVNDDLYIDYGGKFHAVCRRPSNNSQLYFKGARVKLRLLSHELSHRFLGSKVDLTLLEADAVLLGLESSPAISSPQ